MTAALAQNRTATAFLGERLLPAAPGLQGPVGLLVVDGRIREVAAAAGVADAARRLGGETVDLRGYTLVPGFVDAHNHQPTAARDRLELRTASVGTLAELGGLVAERAAALHPGSWITTERNFTRAQVTERRFPTASELDEFAPEHPVAVRVGAHAMALNSAALRASGLLDLADDPPGGWLERDAAGVPLGPVHEYGATRFIDAQLTEPARDELVRALEDVQGEYLMSGVTAVRVPGVRPGELGWYQDLADRGALRTRVAACVRLDPNLGRAARGPFINSWPVRSGFGDELLRLGALKLFVDGGVGAAGSDASFQFIDREQLEEVCSAAALAGWGLTCHAVSEQAVELVLDAYEAAPRPVPTAERTIEHGVFATPSQLHRAADLGVWWSAQPGLGELNSHLLGSSRTAFNPLASGLAAGVRLALGSDWNATPGSDRRPFAPRRSLAAATDNGAESIAPEVALTCHTAGSGELFGVSKLGQLVAGAPADILAFEGVPDAEALADPDGAGPTHVIVAGRIRVRNGALVSAASPRSRSTR